jgi:L-malate glycosyltransferase
VIKVLWITPNILPAPFDYDQRRFRASGGWLGSLAETIKLNITVDLHVISISNLAKYSPTKIGNISYYSIPSNKGVFKYSQVLTNQLKRLVKEIKPDIIDYQGIEFSYARDILEISSGIPTCVTLQGLVSEISKYYLSSISLLDLFKSTTLRDIILIDTLYHRKMNYSRRGKSEKIAIKNTENFIGRTKWDYNIINSHKRKFNYLSFGRRVRASFFKYSWNIENLSKNKLFISQAHAPFKGFHILLDAIIILKKYIPKILVSIAGRDLTKCKFNIPLHGGYQKYILNKIYKNNLRNNIHFLGPLDEDCFAKELSGSSLFILPSLIENSPNSLIEAQICGVPSIVSYVGGSPYMLPLNYDCFFNSQDSHMLASMIFQLLNDPEKAKFISEDLFNFQNNIQSNLDNCDSLINYYDSIINK